MITEMELGLTIGLTVGTIFGMMVSAIIIGARQDDLCPRCGSEIAEGEDACRECGYQL